MLAGASGSPGPVHLQIPIDVSRLSAAAGSTRGEHVPARPSPDVAAVARASELLAGARAPAIILGGGARDAGVPAARLAEKLGAPIGMTINAKGAVPRPILLPCRREWASRRSIGSSSTQTWCSPSAPQLSDLDWWMLARPFGFSGSIIRVDLDEAAFDVPLPSTVAIRGDAHEVLAALEASVARLGSRSRCCEPRPRGARVDRLAARSRDPHAARAGDRRGPSIRPDRDRGLDPARLRRKPRPRRPPTTLVADADRLRHARLRAADGHRRIRRGAGSTGSRPCG